MKGVLPSVGRNPILCCNLECCRSDRTRFLQQSRFDRFRHVFNNERPHEGLNNQTPASLYQPSSVRLPCKMPEFTYSKGLLLRRVNNSGDISWHKHRVFISEVFRFEELGFELITLGFYRVFFRHMEIGEFNAEELRFRSAESSLSLPRECRLWRFPSVKSKKTAFSMSPLASNLNPVFSKKSPLRRSHR